ncbi:hypothetical protein CL635_00890 [bacterium]|nr:hypothetical protein [bacterium]
MQLISAFPVFAWTPQKTHGVLGPVQNEAMPVNKDKYGGDGTVPVVEHEVAIERVTSTWRLCAAECEAVGKRLLWEPEPGFALNKMGDILRVIDGVNHNNFSVMADVCHAHHIAELGSRQPGKKEILPGGIGEFFSRLKGNVGRVHIIDSDGGINEHHTSVHTPLFDGCLNFDSFMRNIAASSDDPVWTIDLCFFPNAWENARKCKDGLDRLISQHG